MRHSPESRYNRKMSKIRTAVEWEFGDVVNKFSFLDFKQPQKIGMSPIGKYYQVGMILKNCLNCVSPNQTSQYFDLDPPTLAEYLA